VSDSGFVYNEHVYSPEVGRRKIKERRDRYRPLYKDKSIKTYHHNYNVSINNKCRALN